MRWKRRKKAITLNYKIGLVLLISTSAEDVFTGGEDVLKRKITDKNTNRERILRKNDAFNIFVNV